MAVSFLAIKKREGFFMSESVTQKKINILSERSKKDAKWDQRKILNQDLEKIFSKINPFKQNEFYEKFKNYPKRLKGCSDFLEFALRADKETGLEVLKLSYAEFCRIRHCPICQSRLSMKWIAKFHQIMPDLLNQYENTQFLLLTLTIKNCDVQNLRSTIQSMNKAWDRLCKRKFFKEQILGFIRSTEVTKNNNNEAHPHFHVLLHVKNSYFNGRNYVSQIKWISIWRSCLKVNYDPIVDIRKVRESKKRTKEENLISGALEVVKYATKQSNIVADENWFFEFCLQVDRLRFMSTGGSLKELIADLEKDDLIHIEEDESEKEENLSEDLGDRIVFVWDNKKHYRRDPKRDYVDDQIIKK